MAEGLFSTKASLDTTDFKTGTAEIGRELRVLESGFRASAAGLQDWSKDAGGLETRIKTLNKEIELQGKKVALTREEYERMVKTYGANSKEAQDMEIRLNKETESLNKMQTELRGTETGLDNLKSGNEAAGKSAEEMGKKQESLAQQLKGTYTEISSAIGLAKQAYQLLKGAVDETVGTFITYAGQVREISQVTGQNAEEVSRMIQVTDDYKIKTESLNMVMKKMATEGMPLTIDSLAELSDEYLQLEPGVERQIFLTEKFGRAGADFAEIMLAGGNAIRMQSDAIADNLIMTDDAVRKAREYEIAQDDLEDAVQGLKIAIGQELTPALISLVNATNDAIEMQGLSDRAQELGISLTEEHSIWAGRMNIVTKTYADLLKEVTEAEKAAADAAYYLAGGDDEASRAAAKLATLTRDLVTDLADYGAQLDAVSSLGQMFTEQTQDMDAALQNVKFAQDEYDLALTTGKGLETATKKLGNTQQAVEDLKVAQQKQTDQWMLNCIYQAMGTDGITSAEMAFLLQYQVDTGLISEEARIRAQDQWNMAMDMVDGYNEAQKAAAAIETTLNNIPTNITSTVDIIRNEYVNYWKSEKMGGVIGQAAGGDYLVRKPTLFLAGEAGPERATFTPINSEMGSEVDQLSAAMRGLAASYDIAVNGRMLAGAAAGAGMVNNSRNYQYTNHITNAGIDAKELERIQRRQELLYGS